MINSIPASQVFNKSKAKSNTKQIIPTIIFLAFIKDEEFAVNLNLIYVFSNQQVNFTALFADWDTSPPVISIVMPLLFSVSHDVSIDGRHAKVWRRSKNSEPGWAAECDLGATCDGKRDKER